MVAGAATALLSLQPGNVHTWTRAHFGLLDPSVLYWVPRFLPSTLYQSLDKPTDNAMCADRAVKGLPAWEYHSGPAQDLEPPPNLLSKTKTKVEWWNRVSMIRPICIDYYVPLNCYCLARGCPSSFYNRFLENCIIYIYRRSYPCRQWNLSWKFLTFIVKVLLCNAGRWKKCLKFHLVFKYIFSVIRRLILRWSWHWDFNTFTKFHLSMQCRKKFLKWNSAYIF